MIADGFQHLLVVEYFKGLATFSEGQKIGIASDFDMHIKPIVSQHGQEHTKNLLDKLFLFKSEFRKDLIRNYVPRIIDHEAPTVDVQSILEQ